MKNCSKRDCKKFMNSLTNPRSQTQFVFSAVVHKIHSYYPVTLIYVRQNPFEHKNQLLRSSVLSGIKKRLLLKETYFVYIGIMHKCLSTFSLSQIIKPVFHFDKFFSRNRISKNLHFILISFRAIAKANKENHPRSHIVPRSSIFLVSISSRRLPDGK